MFLSYVTHYIRRAGRCSFSTGCPFRTLPYEAVHRRFRPLLPTVPAWANKCPMPFWETKPRESLRHVPTRQAPARLPFCPHPPCRIHRSHGSGREARHRSVWLSTPQNSSSPSVLRPVSLHLFLFPSMLHFRSLHLAFRLFRFLCLFQHVRKQGGRQLCLISGHILRNPDPLPLQPRHLTSLNFPHSLDLRHTKELVVFGPEDIHTLDKRYIHVRRCRAEQVLS